MIINGIDTSLIKSPVDPWYYGLLDGALYEINKGWAWGVAEVREDGYVSHFKDLRQAFPWPAKQPLYDSIEAAAPEAWC